MIWSHSVRRRGGGYAKGAPGFGYRAEAKAFALSPDDAEHATVTRIVALRGRRSLLRRVSVILTAEGHKPKRGTKWHCRVVAADLGSPRRDDGNNVAIVTFTTLRALSVINRTAKRHAGAWFSPC